MVIKGLSDRVLLPTKKDVLRVHLYFKLIQFGIKPLHNDMEIMLELYLFGGYDGPDQQRQFIDICMNNKLKKSTQSVRNTLSKYVRMGVFEKPRNSILHISDKYVPKVDCDKLILQHIISHAE